MENKLSFNDLPSLKDMALKAVAINLWKEPDVLTLIEVYPCIPASHFYDNLTTDWCEAIESHVAAKISKLKLPKLLEEQLLVILTPIGLEIKRWKAFHENFFKMVEKGNLSSSVLAKLCWTNTGMIDCKKTAQELVGCELLNIVDRYKLACLYCLKDYIPIFLEEIPEKIKKEFYDAVGQYGHSMDLMLNLKLEFCWPWILEGEQCRLDTACRLDNSIPFNLHAFEFSAVHGNKAAVEYFFQKLTEEEKKDSVTRAVNGVIQSRFLQPLCDHLVNFSFGNMTYVLCYLLSKLDYEKQMEIIKAKPIQFLMCFFDWPWQDIFLKIANLTWAYIPEQDYDDLLLPLGSSFKISNYCFPKLFREFFMQSPVNFKKAFVDEECQSGSFFKLIFDKKDLETIKVIFRNIETVDRVRLVSSQGILRRFFDHILEENYHMVQLCLREATLSNEDRKKLNEVWKGYFQYMPLDERKDFLNRLFQLLSETVPEVPSKRNLTQRNINDTKRQCCEK